MSPQNFEEFPLNMNVIDLTRTIICTCMVAWLTLIFFNSIEATCAIGKLSIKGVWIVLKFILEVLRGVQRLFYYTYNYLKQLKLELVLICQIILKLGLKVIGFIVLTGGGLYMIALIHTIEQMLVDSTRTFVKEEKEFFDSSRSKSKDLDHSDQNSFDIIDFTVNLKSTKMLFPSDQQNLIQNIQKKALEQQPIVQNRKKDLEDCATTIKGINTFFLEIPECTQIITEVSDFINDEILEEKLNLTATKVVCMNKSIGKRILRLPNIFAVVNRGKQNLSSFCIDIKEEAQTFSKQPILSLDQLKQLKHLKDLTEVNTMCEPASDVVLEENAFSEESLQKILYIKDTQISLRSLFHLLAEKKMFLRTKEGLLKPLGLTLQLKNLTTIGSIWTFLLQILRSEEITSPFPAHKGKLKSWDKDDLLTEVIYRFTYSGLDLSKSALENFESQTKENARYYIKTIYSRFYNTLIHILNWFFPVFEGNLEQISDFLSYEFYDEQKSVLLLPKDFKIKKLQNYKRYLLHNTLVQESLLDFLKSLSF